MPIPLEYGDFKTDCAYRIDMVVDGLVVVEVKCVEKLAPIHRAQMLTYLRLTGCPLGLLINFNVPVLTQGIRRVANNLRDDEGNLADLGEDGLRGCRDVSSNASLLRGLCVLCGERLFDSEPSR